jgi:hypothetical protein
LSASTSGRRRDIDYRQRTDELTAGGDVGNTRFVVDYYFIPKGSFGSHHLELESKNLFTILTITYLAAIELVMEFILNFMFSSHA